MKRLFSILPFLIICCLTFLTSSCTQDAYEKGEGKYSLMRGDFVEARTDANKQVVSMTTDDGDLLPLVKPYSAKWITTADTIYRCMLYYNKVEQHQGQYAAEVLSMGQVPCVTIKPLSDFDKEFRTDPVKFESIWLSKSGKYLNLYLHLKTGVTEDTSAVHQLAFLTDTLLTYPNGMRTRRLLLHHDQNHVPEYYSTKAYVSIPTSQLDADSAHIIINTYSGKQEKVIPLQHL